MSDFRMHRWTRPGSILGILFVSQMALAQSVPSNIRSSPSAGQFAQQIDSFVSSQATRLKTAGSERAAREALIAQVLGTPSPSFCDAYAVSINSALKPLAAEKDMRVRLNAAVVNAEVARHCNNFSQAEATLLFMKDKSQPVAIWGLKAAKYEIPVQLTAQPVLRKPNLMAEVVPVVKSRGNVPALDDGPLVEEAYEALTLSPDKSEAYIKAADIAAIRDLLPEVFALLEFRTTLYAAAAPPAPTVDNAAALFLVKSKVWAVETPAQQNRTKKDLADLLDAIAGIWDPTADSREELMKLAQATARSFVVIAQTSSNQALLNAAEAMAQVNTGTPVADFKQHAADLKTAVDAAIAG